MSQKLRSTLFVRYHCPNIFITLATIVSHMTIIHNTTKGANCDTYLPGIHLVFIGNPKKYLIGPGVLMVKYAASILARVDNMIVTKKDLRYGIQSVPESKTTNTC